MKPGRPGDGSGGDWLQMDVGPTFPGETDMDERLGLPQGAFAKIDAEEDELFYEPPRLVCHIDDGAIAALTEFYRTALPVGGGLLALMRSWVSHLPPEIDYAEVIGHGMNETELAANPRLTRWFIQNLNRETTLPLADAGVDGAWPGAGAAARRASGLQFLQPVLLDKGRRDLASAGRFESRAPRRALSPPRR